MQILTEGHRYLLNSYEGTQAQVLQFIEKRPRDDNSTELVTVNDGTTNEEVLAVLIDRMKSLNAKFPCRENSIVITKLEESLMWLEKRTADRLKRGAEGKQIS